MAETDVAAYATLSDLQEYLGEPPPEGAEKYLLRARRVLDDIAEISWIHDPYRVPVDTRHYGLPTETEIEEALRLASCQQIEYWMVQGGGVINDDQDVLQLTHMGKLDGETMPALPRLAPRAKQTLQSCGLWQSGPHTEIYWWQRTNRRW